MCDEATEESLPEQTVFTGTDVKGEHLTLTGSFHADSSSVRHALDSSSFSYFREGCIQLDVREFTFERAVPERLNYMVELLADT